MKAAQKKGGKGSSVLSGRALFAYDPTMFKDDEGAIGEEEYESGSDEEEEGQEEEGKTVTEETKKEEVIKKKKEEVKIGQVWETKAAPTPVKVDVD